jgi:hypothetical protein
MECMRLMKCCGMAVKRMGKLEASVRQKKALTEYGENDTDW